MLYSYFIVHFHHGVEAEETNDAEKDRIRRKEKKKKRKKMKKKKKNIPTAESDIYTLYSVQPECRQAK